MKIINIFSHKLTEEQVSYLNKTGVFNHIYLPENLQKIWSNIPPEKPEINTLIKPILEWIEKNSEKDDLILVQGDFGATYITVNFCFKKGLIPVYATTERKAIEKNIDGKIVIERIFSHVIFRKYEKIFYEII
ncbi:MAG: CRISPR-associated protein Csx20 [Candidatus Muiribacteriota bacterium]